MQGILPSIASITNSNTLYHYKPRALLECIETQDHVTYIQTLPMCDFFRFNDKCKSNYDSLKQLASGRIANIVKMLNETQRQRHLETIAAAAASQSRSWMIEHEVFVCQTDIDKLCNRLGLLTLEQHYDRTVQEFCNDMNQISMLGVDMSSIIKSNNSQTLTDGDNVLGQIKTDFYSRFEPYEMQIEIFESTCEMMGSRIYHDWHKNWRSICARNNWHDPRLRRGTAACECPRRHGKTTAASRTGLALAMNIPKFKGVNISTDMDTACILIADLIEQALDSRKGIPRFMRDFGYKAPTSSVVKSWFIFWPKSDPNDIRCWMAIPGGVSCVFFSGGIVA